MLSVYTWGYFCLAYIRRSNVSAPIGSGCYIAHSHARIQALIRQVLHLGIGCISIIYFGMLCCILDMYYILYLGVGCILCIGLCDYYTGMWQSAWDCICSSTVTNACNTVDDIYICACVGTNPCTVLLNSLRAYTQPPGYTQPRAYISLSLYFSLWTSTLWVYTLRLVGELSAQRFITNFVRA